MRRRVVHQVVVIAGASSGIGRGAALAFAARGADVVLAARGVETLEEVARQCREAGGRALVVPTDVTDEAAVQSLARRAVEEFGRIDAWVNAAAVWSYGRFEDTPGPVFRQVVDTTLFGQVHGARAVLPQFRLQGRGVLVNIVSIYGQLSSPYVSSYVAAKWGLLGLTEVLRQELRDAPGISVCAVLPGAVDTPIYRHAANYVGHRIRPLPPVVAPERVVAAVVRAVDRPEPMIYVGRAHHLAARLHRLTPRLYGALVKPFMDEFALQDAPAAPREGNVFAPDTRVSGVDDGWRRHDRRRAGRAATAAVALAAAGAAASGLLRGRTS
ncbi:short-subunit dehydrogenase [Kineococcus xinjiangensis]|uniref:Short-subunit dehydrogenase n=1 Tax=Kineococcus xinjiangensis TaxID=512762 RepID=A0A2S6IKB7_9ACTN|nr:SDR family NAD(P)-dependent oxidoreductase [Kineococcus xinjiangensis]PPK94674.1 short-subunit dehydrogenase [Kineococcus xinjiangensis]